MILTMGATLLLGAVVGVVLVDAMSAVECFGGDDAHKGMREGECA